MRELRIVLRFMVGLTLAGFVLAFAAVAGVVAISGVAAMIVARKFGFSTRDTCGTTAHKNSWDDIGGKTIDH